MDCCCVRSDKTFQFYGCRHYFGHCHYVTAKRIRPSLLLQTPLQTAVEQNIFRLTPVSKCCCQSQKNSVNVAFEHKKRLGYGYNHCFPEYTLRKKGFIGVLYIAQGSLLNSKEPFMLKKMFGPTLY